MGQNEPFSAGFAGFGSFAVSTAESAPESVRRLRIRATMHAWHRFDHRSLTINEFIIVAVLTGPTPIAPSPSDKLSGVRQVLLEGYVKIIRLLTDLLFRRH